MRPKLLSGESTVLIVKDFSRFSRRNSLGLLELEILRDAGVRIISIGDNIDFPTRDDWMLIQFKFLMNEFPVTDTSKKIKAILRNRQKSGNWICNVPYGYRLINTKEMLYEVDPAAAEVVREIFDLYNSGWGYKKIANYLTDKGIPTPRTNEIAWRESMGQKTKLKSKNEWSIISVSSALSNDFYIGTLRQGKYTRKGINGVDTRIDDDEHIVIENAHTPIIDPKTFWYTQEQLKQRSKTNYRGEKKYATNYSGYLFCGDCGAPMFSMSRPDLKPAYTCGTYHRRGRAGCTSHHVRVDKLDELLKRYIAKVRDNSADILTQLEEAIKHQPEREQEIGLAIDSLERQLADSKEQLKTLFKRKLMDTMGKSPDEAALIDEAYTDLEKELTSRIKGLEQQINDNIHSRNHLLQTTRAAKTVMDVFDDILNKPKLDKKDIGLIVDRITIYEPKDDSWSGCIDIQLKADIDGLLRTGNWEGAENFPLNSKDILSIPQEIIVQSAKQRPNKVFTVNVINSGEAKHNNTVWLWQREEAYLSHASFTPIRLKEQDIYQATFTRRVRDEEIDWTPNPMHPVSGRSAPSIAPAVTDDMAVSLAPADQTVMTGGSSAPSALSLLSAVTSAASMSGTQTAAPRHKVINYTGWQKTDDDGTVLYPCHGQTFLTEVTYLNSSAAAVLLKTRAYQDDIIRLAKHPNEEDVLNLVIDLGLEFVEYGFALGILKDLAELIQNEQLNEILQYIKISKTGTASGVIIYTYKRVVHATDNRVNQETYIQFQTFSEYETWDGTGLKARAKTDTKNMSGKWSWSFT